MNFKDGEYPVPACFTGETDVLSEKKIESGETMKDGSAFLSPHAPAVSANTETAAENKNF